MDRNIIGGGVCRAGGRVAPREGGVDRNLPSAPLTAPPGLSLPARGAWIATFAGWRERIRGARRSPRGGRGSQHHRWRCLPCWRPRRSPRGGVDRNLPSAPLTAPPGLSLPARGAWIATFAGWRERIRGARRSPRGGRGSQHLGESARCGVDRESLPARGAWIATCSMMLENGDVLVAPREGGVDRNMMAELTPCRVNPSLPARGAWIATLMRRDLGRCRSGSLPARGAWIATQVSRVAKASGQSLPARGAWIATTRCPLAATAAVAPREGGVDRNTKQLSTRVEEGSRSPRGGRGSQPVSGRDPADQLSSLPARGAWIATFHEEAREDHSLGRSPRGGRGSQPHHPD